MFVFVYFFLTRLSLSKVLVTCFRAHFLSVVSSLVVTVIV